MAYGLLVSASHFLSLKLLMVYKLQIWAVPGAWVAIQYNRYGFRADIGSNFPAVFQAKTWDSMQQGVFSIEWANL